MGDGVGWVGRRGGPSIALTPALSPAFCCLLWQLHDDLEMGLVGRGPSSEGSTKHHSCKCRLPKAAAPNCRSPPLSPEQACPGACLRGVLGGRGSRGLGQWPEAWRGEAGSGIDRDLGVNLDSAINKVYVGGKPCNPLSLKLLGKIRQRGRRGLRDLRRSGHRAPAVTVPGLWGLRITQCCHLGDPGTGQIGRGTRRQDPTSRATGTAGTEGLRAQSQEEGMPAPPRSTLRGPQGFPTDKKPRVCT